GRRHRAVLERAQRQRRLGRGPEGRQCRRRRARARGALHAGLDERDPGTRGFHAGARRVPAPRLLAHAAVARRAAGRARRRGLGAAMRLLPVGTPREARLIFLGRGFRAFGDGFVSLLLLVYLIALGFDAFEVGVLTAATLLGSAVLTLAVGFVAP